MATSTTHACAAFACAGLVTVLITEPVRRLAIRTSFFDLPVGYKRHRRPTPYLGGTAVMVGLVAGMLAGGWPGGMALVAAGALAVYLMGTADDRLNLGIRLRLVVQLGAALLAWLGSARWNVGGDVISLLITVIWIVGLTNALNLMDNQDGAAGTVGAVAAAGTGAFALSNGENSVAIVAFALSGACAGFLPHNLSKPARIFLGDGGSMPIGFLLASLVLLAGGGEGATSLVVLPLLVALPIFDTALVVISRRRRGVEVLQGGRDHTTHRLLGLVGSPQRVALCLALVQAVLCGLSILLDSLGAAWVWAVGVSYMLLAAGLISALESLERRQSVLAAPDGAPRGAPARS